MSRIIIIRASAGSGKTHRLTGEFLKMLLQEPTDYFKGILAVTFTNKATAEMKSRLIEQLNILAKNEHSEYLEELKNITQFKEEHIRNKSAAILHHILHQYSWFSIETIDTFFQRIIRAFTRELAIPGNYNIELDTLPILEYAVDNLINEIEEGSYLLNWLVQFAESRIEDGRPWDIRKELINLGEEVFKEDFASVSPQIYAALTDKLVFENYKKLLNHIVNESENIISDFGKRGISIINNHNFEDSDFFKGSTGVTSFFRKLADKNLILPQPYILKMAEGPEEWPSSKTKKKESVIEVASRELLPLLKEIIHWIQLNSSRYFTAREILKNIYSLGILTDIAAKILEYCREKNTFILSDSAVFINRIIDQNDAPFIYEKMGNRYNHFMIDEFQDTSFMQWNNFKPLINNSLASGNNNLLVGDVKQSIYRWRNSSWEVLANKVQLDYIQESIRIENLEINWRSSEEIVNFNNQLFPKASEILQNHFNDKLSKSESQIINNFYRISEIYKEVSQKIPDKSKNKGNVQVRFFRKDAITEDDIFFAGSLLEDLRQLFENGYQARDIAILVRRKSEGKIIADFLIEKNSNGFFEKPFQVISNESLFLSSSRVVNMMIAAMQFIVSPEDDINRGKLAFFYNVLQSSYIEPSDLNDIYFRPYCSTINELTSGLPEAFIKNIALFQSLSLYDLLERIITAFKADQDESDLPYLHALLDLVYEYTQNNPSDISKFIEYWNKDGKNKSVSVSENQNAVKILTIHKSKGLQFKAVIVPFCNWPIDQKPNTILWTNALSDDFNYLPVIPVNYTAGLLHTEFAKKYLDELVKSYVDNLNLLYVTLTRAEESLIIYSVYKDPEKKDYSISSIGDLVYQAIRQSSLEKESDGFDKDKDIYKSGFFKNIELAKNNDLITENIIKQGSSGQLMDRLFLNYSSKDYFENTSNDLTTPAKKGTVLHQILAGISTINEIKKTTDKAIYDGLINATEATELQRHLEQCLSDQKTKVWFDGSGEIMNEAEIIIPGGEIRRPDRVVIYRDHLDIIDYKFGQNKNVHEHGQQVNEYMRLAVEMGYRNVKGYVWYIVTNEIVEV
jgi:ATP-dependent helicase/nuclease subunit A